MACTSDAWAYVTSSWRAVVVENGTALDLRVWKHASICSEGSVCCIFFIIARLGMTSFNIYPRALDYEWEALALRASMSILSEVAMVDQ